MKSLHPLSYRNNVAHHAWSLDEATGPVVRQTLRKLSYFRTAGRLGRTVCRSMDPEGEKDNAKTQRARRFAEMWRPADGVGELPTAISWRSVPLRALSLWRPLLRDFLEGSWFRGNAGSGSKYVRFHRWRLGTLLR